MQRAKCMCVYMHIDRLCHKNFGLIIVQLFLNLGQSDQKLNRSVKRGDFTLIFTVYSLFLNLLPPLVFNSFTQTKSVSIYWDYLLYGCSTLINMGSNLINHDKCH